MVHEEESVKPSESKHKKVNKISEAQISTPTPRKGRKPKEVSQASFEEIEAVDEAIIDSTKPMKKTEGAKKVEISTPDTNRNKTNNQIRIKCF